MKTVSPMLNAETRRELFAAGCGTAANTTPRPLSSEAVRLAEAAKHQLFDLWTAQRLASSALTSTSSR